MKRFLYSVFAWAFITGLFANPMAFAAATACTSGSISDLDALASRTVSWNSPVAGAQPASSPFGPGRLLVTGWRLPVTVVPARPPDPDPEGSGPVTISLSEAVIGDGFFDIIDLTITGLSLGQTVLLEKFRVNNDEGVIDGGAILQESHRLTDGVAAAVGETFNWNRLFDVTERDGVIEAQLDFWEPSAASIPGKYVYRVSSPLGSFDPQTARLTVTSDSAPQRFSGTVTAGGQPVPGAVVALLDPLTGYADFLKGTFTDASGDYVLDAPFEDEFDIVALKPGYVGPFAVGTGWFIEEGETVTADLVLEAGTRMISGTLQAADTDDPLPGMEIVFISLDEEGRFDNRLCTIVWTDDQGRYDVAVTPDRWGAMVRVETASKIGFVTSAERPLMVADTRTADVAGTVTPLPRAGSVVWGRVVSSDLVDAEGEQLGLGGIEVMGIDEDSGIAAWTVTDADGDYRLGLAPGRWQVFPFSYSLEESAHAGVVARELVLTAEGQSIEQDFAARPAGGADEQLALLDWIDDPDVSSSGSSSGGEVWGFVEHATDGPVGRFRLLAYNTDATTGESAVQATYESDGYYNFYLPEGTWLVAPDPDQAAERGLVFKNLPRVTVTDDVSEEVSIAAVDATATIEVTITDSTSAPVPDLLIHAHGTAEDGAYNAYARTDGTGVARIPAVTARWALYVQETTTDAAGMVPLAPVSVTVNGDLATASLQAQPFSNEIPRILHVGTEDGAFTFSGSGESGRVYAFEVSTDLADWYEIGRARAENQGFALVDGTADQVRLFYRVIRP